MRRISLHVIALLAAVAVLAPASASAASWATQSVPEPGGTLSSALNGVHCTSTTACTAVGRYDDAGTQRSIAQRWNGASWSNQTTPFPAGALEAELSGVFCTGATACRAVGTYRDSGNIGRTLGATWNGVSWSQDTTPNPAGSPAASLSAIHCTSASACTAVGSYIDGGVQKSLAQRWNGLTWSTQTTPTPSGASQWALTGVACTGASACTAVGWYVTGGTRVTLAMTWNGSTWSTQATPNPGSHTGSDLAGISCTGASACTAVGTSLNASRQAQPMSMRWNGSAWSLDTVPLPGGASGGSFSGVSCTSGTHCTAVGYQYGGTNIPFSLAETWNGATWSAQTAANPAGALDARLRGASCTSSAWCEASGGFTNASRQERAFAEKWS